MDYGEKLIDDNFFIIDSNNLKTVKNKFYGFSIEDYNIISKENIDKHSLNGSGAYINVKVNEKEIIIEQDLIGSYGLYYYERNNYFAISNSFIKLSEYLKKNEKLSLNKDYANAFLFSGLASYAYEETLINEIKFIDRNIKIIIKKDEKKIIFDKIDYGLNSVDIDSQEGIEILDDWYYKWVENIRSLKKKTNNIAIDLSGGYDTRVLAALWLTANIDINKLYIYTIEKDMRRFNEDYEIASAIGKEFGFKLNKNVMDIEEKRFKNPLTPIDISFYSKLCFHKQMYFRYHKVNKEFYSISGYAGGSIRGHPNQSLEKYEKTTINRSGHKNKFLLDSSKLIFENGMNKVMKEFNITNLNKIPEIMHNEIRVRHHFGKSIVEHFLVNEYILTPFIDLNLQKLKINSEKCDDNNLLIGLIYLRYCPKLLDFKFEGGRYISDEVIKYAKEINKKYPFVKKEYEFISGPEIKNIKTDKIYSKDNEKENFSVEYLKNVFYTSKFKNAFTKLYPIDFYYEIVDIIENHNYHPLLHLFSAMAIIKINDDINSNPYNLNEWLKSFIENPNDNFNPVEKLESFKNNKSRIDIINLGNKTNSVEIIEDKPTFSRYEYPKFLKKENGSGTVLETSVEEINFKIKCINNGTVKIYLKDINHKENKNIKNIEYYSVLINNEEYLNENLICSFKKPYLIEKEVKDNEIIDVKIKWKGINNHNNNKKEKETDKNNNKLKNKIKKVFVNFFK